MKHSIDRRGFITKSLLATSGIALGINNLEEEMLLRFSAKLMHTREPADKQVKILFFDFREIEIIKGFTRELGKPVKHEKNPLFIADAPWENGNMQLYGSVIKAPGKPFQMWYSVIHKPWNMLMAYAESADGINWQRPLFDIFKFQGERTNIIFTNNPHGPAVIYDETENREDWRYKMVAGADPTGRICAYHSADGIYWIPVREAPILQTKPDCPMGFLRTLDGRYVIYHRFDGFGRRIFRSESLNFTEWPGEPRMVIEPDAGDPPQIQCYGMGSTTYGPLEIGTLWMYHTDPGDVGSGKMKGFQETELTYARSGYAWHRAAQGKTFIPHGEKNDWDRGNLQCASSPIFLDNEIRYYYMGTNMTHKSHWELDPQTAGLGLATLKPDRFISLRAGNKKAEFLTYSLNLTSDKVFVNASTKKSGWVRLEVLDPDGKPIAGFNEADCSPINGDSISHPVHWNGAKTGTTIADRRVRIRLTAENADVFSIYCSDSYDLHPYYRFSVGRP
jgi:hypothetical protein